MEEGLEVSAQGSAFPIARLDSSVVGVNPPVDSLGGGELLSFVVDVKAPLVAPEVANPRVLSKDVIVVCDVSGSMGSAMGDVKTTIKLLVSALEGTDRFALVTFNGSASTALPLQHPTDQEKKHITTVVDSLVVNGNTNISDALAMALNITTAAQQFSGRFTHIILLSDGQPNSGLTNTTQIITACQTQLGKMNNLPQVPQVVFHSLGFTTGHNAELLRSISTVGNAGSGQYYFLKTPEDIRIATGDCLGSVKNVLYYGIRAQCTPMVDNATLADGWACHIYDGSNLSAIAAVEQPPVFYHLGYLSATEQRNFVVLCLPHTAQAKKLAAITGSANALVPPGAPTCVKVSLHFVVAATGAEMSVTSLAPILPNSTPSLAPPRALQQAPVASPASASAASASSIEVPIPEAPVVEMVPHPHYCHVMTHIMRLRVAHMLPKLVGRSESDREQLENLHGALVETLALVQASESPDKQVQVMVARDESILMALERDLGDALENSHQDGRVSSQDAFRLAQFSHEHAQQKSASTSTELRPTYSTPEQQAMRIRFGATATEAVVEKSLNDEASKLKAALPTKEAHLSTTQIEKRVAADSELQCFVTLENWRECDIGIGLQVKPRTVRERYKGLIPEIHIANDYLSTTAYNQGAKALFAKVGSVDRDHDKNFDNTVMSSSARGKINSFLPVYVNATHWQFVRRYAPSAFSLIATQRNDAFKPTQALQVCSKLMCTCVVQFCDNSLHVSERAIQIYCDIHRLALQMAEEYPEIQELVTRKLKDFIEKLACRGRGPTPDIGVLIQFLALTDALSWTDFKDAYLHESFRRSSRWVESRMGKKAQPELPDEELVAFWHEATKVSTSLMLFNVMFLEKVARPEGHTMATVKQNYDLSWGRVPSDVISEIKKAHQSIMAVNSLPEVMQRIGMPSTIKEIAELIRWAIANEKEVQVPRDLRHKKADEGNALYQRITQNRSLGLTALTKAAEAQRRSVELGVLLERVLKPGVPLKDPVMCHTHSKNADFYVGGMVAQANVAPAPTLNDTIAVSLDTLLKDDEISKQTEGILAVLRQRKVCGELVFARCSESVMSRAAILQCPAASAVKEMVLLVNGEPCLVVTTGFGLVNATAVGAHFNSSARLCDRARIALYTGFPWDCVGVAGHLAIDKPLKIVLNSRCAADPTTIVYTSCGVKGYYLKLTVAELQKLLGPGISTVNTD